MRSLSEAIIDFKEVQSILEPIFKGQTVRVVWDEGKAIVTLVKNKRTLKAYGSLAAFADTSKIPSEKDAWQEAAVDKNANSRC